MRHEESKLQQVCVKWFRYAYPKSVIFAIPNGGARNKIEAAIMKGEGVLAGVADLFVMHANGRGSHGLFIELKTAQGKQTDSQRLFQLQAENEMYWYGIVRSLEEFMLCVTGYFEGRESAKLLYNKLENVEQVFKK